MWFWWFMLVSDLLIPVLMIIFGKVMWKHPPQKINGMIGYRTSRSMKNMDTWRFAHNYCGRLWWKTGWAILIPSLLLHIPFYYASDNMVGGLGCILCMVQGIALLVPVFFTERALKKNFPY